MIVRFYQQHTSLVSTAISVGNSKFFDTGLIPVQGTKFMKHVNYVIYVEKQCIEHFESMLAWLREYYGIGRFQWFNYDSGSYFNHSQIHFTEYNEEYILMFILKFNGKTSKEEIRKEHFAKWVS